MIDVNPAKLGVDNPSPRRREQRPFESWAELDAVAANLAPRYRPMVIFAAATGLRPAEWLALERRDVDREARVVYVRRSFTKGRLKCTKTEASRRAVPLQAIALEAIERQPSSPHSPLLFPAERGGYLDLHNFRNREWKPAQCAAGIEPLRRVYDLRHAFATFALRAGISTFDLSPLHGRQPDDDRPPLRPPRTRRARTRDSPARRTQRGTTSTVDAGGRCVDAKAGARRQ
jgi:integrase